MPATPRKLPSQERSRRTVERLLDAAARIFHDHGYAAATTNDIADEAGVSVGSIYQYFPNKDALLVALTRRHIAATTMGLSDMLGNLPRTTGIDALVRAVVDFLVAQHDLDELHLLVAHEAPRTQEITTELERARSQLVEMASHVLASRILDPSRRALIARMVVATIDASVHDVIIRQSEGKARDAAIEITVATALSIIESA